MRMLLDTSVVLASLDENEPTHQVCSELMLGGESVIYVHAISEVFSTLTGSTLARRVSADIAAQLLQVSVLPFVKSIVLTEREIINALGEAKSRGVRGGAVYDYLHLVAAKKSAVEAIATLNVRHFQALTLPGDPRIDAPA